MLEKINKNSKLYSFKSRFSEQNHKEDPLSSVANLLDLMVVFAVGLMLAIVTYYGLPELLSKDEEVTLVKNPGSKNMEIIKKDAKKLERYRITRDQLSGEGQRIGTVYRLKDGEVVYVPEFKKKGNN